MTVSLTFLGGAGTVTGSKYLLEHDKRSILVDCGLFQGFKVLRLRNWAKLRVQPSTIDSVVLTHAHLDHSGYLPLLVKNGFRGRIHCSNSTAELCRILLPDSGHVQERDAEFANRHGFSKHKHALPLYTQQDAEACLKQFAPLSFDEPHQLGKGITVRLRRMGHILGAASAEVRCDEITTVFSGDIGRFDDELMVDPVQVERADYLVVESTYGDRLHSRERPEDALAEIVARTVHRGGTVIVPAFAVGRAQSVLYYVEKLKAAGRLPRTLPIFLDSPMAIDAGDVFCRHRKDHRLTEEQCRTFACGAHYVREPGESKALTANPMPKIVVSASGMATGGRVLHHLAHYAPDPRNTILFTGFQAGGTRGALMVAGAEVIKIHGTYVPVRAEVRNLDMLSAHADRDEILRWLRGFSQAPRLTFVTHGEPLAADALRRSIEEKLKWSAIVPDHGEKVELA